MPIVCKWVLGLSVLLYSTVGQTTGVLRVCSDPNNLPFSNRQRQGFENKLANMLAKTMGRTVQYTWMPQRRSFFRRTLLANECDVVMGVPAAFQSVSTTRPYYRSTYAFVSAHERKLHIQSFDDPVLKDLRIGLHAVGAEGTNTPPAQALSKRGLVRNIVGFRMWEARAVTNPPGRIVDAVAHGDIDLAIAWGPFAGYFAKKYGHRLDVAPLAQETDGGIPFAYDISLGVRKADTALLNELQTELDRHASDIRKLLTDFRIPLVDAH